MCTSTSSTLFRLLFFVSILLAAITHAAPLSPTYDERMKDYMLGPTKERNPPWILNFYDAYLDEGDRKAFTRNLRLGTQDIGNSIQDGLGVYGGDIVAKLKKDYQGYKKDEVFVKILGEPGDDKSGCDKEFSEVKALKAVGLYVDSGMAPVGRGGKGAAVIIMKKSDGVLLPIKDTIQYKNALSKEKDEMIASAKPIIRKQVVDWAVAKGFLHVDFHVDNLLFGGTETAAGISLNLPVSQVHILGFSYPGIFKVEKGVTEQQVENWFDLQWEACMVGYLSLCVKEEDEIEKKKEIVIGKAGLKFSSPAQLCPTRPSKPFYRYHGRLEREKLRASKNRSHGIHPAL
ncbi:hypothetical protein DFH05DRAFT_529219 [Lentinula detonsa]|uniref:Protein kinase domain-containing protein n=1 Tax=Lentinula detonsa TaxID=2804962 RepID=A0A9W8NR03_9AGAR|nr:hypothetical protein DFH05DRAFT_529219 [Lentinula detonsa]